MRKRTNKAGETVLAGGLFSSADESRESAAPPKKASQPLVVDEQAVDRVAAGPASNGRGKLIAKKDFTIRQNEYLRVIKAGEDLSDVPERYHVNLRTEGVL